MSRPSQSRPPPERRWHGPRVWRGAPLLAVLAAATGALADATAECPPFDAPYPVVVSQVSLAQAGGAEPGAARGAGARGGAIVELPAPPAELPGTPSGEALVALPKGGGGALPPGLELAEGARIVESFFSAVLCATVARVVGAPDASPAQLVPGVPDTATVVPNTTYATAQAQGAPATPDPAPDPYRPLQYGLEQTGVEAARSRSDGGGVRVALLDSAPEVGHRDLPDVALDRIEGGPGAAAAVHGTLMAGVIAAIERNGFGMAGVAPGAELVAVPVCTPAGATAADHCALYHLLRGVDRAWEREARVVNLSLVGPGNPLLERAMARLDQLGVLVVASAGNEGTDAPRYPAAYPSVIGVGAVDRERRLYARGNRGASAEILAPGVEVLSAVPGDAFAFGSGTSFAAAHVSGVLAVLLGSGADSASARAALFQQAHEDAEGGPALLPPVCDVLARLGRPCGTSPARQRASGSSVTIPSGPRP